MTTALPTWLRGAAVAATFVAARLIAAAVPAALAHVPIAFDAPGELVAAVVVGGTGAWLAPRLTGAPWAKLGALWFVTFTSVAAVMLEGSAFAPALSPPTLLPLGLVLQLGVSGLVAGVAVLVSPGSAPGAPRRLALARALPWRVAGASIIYVGAYLGTGAVSYLLVTGPYYETHAGGVTTPEPSLVLALAVIEGLLLALGTTPLALTLAGSRRARAAACGLALWLLGGIVPLLQVASLPDVLRIASAVEILFQKVPLGVAVVWLLAPADRETEPGMRPGR